MFRNARMWAAAALLALVAGCGGADQPAPTAAPDRALADQAFTRHGIYWNPAEPGTGFFFEGQGLIGVVTFFTFRPDGTAAWFSGSGTLLYTEKDTFAFTGSLQSYSGGMAASATVNTTPASVDAGAVNIEFRGDSAAVRVNGTSYKAEKFVPTAGARPAGAKQPETGIYWNPKESGRGYTVEVDGDVATIGVFHYQPSGPSTWNLVVGDVKTGRLVADFTQYAGGQALGQPYKGPGQASSGGTFSADLSLPCSGTITLPGRATPVAVQRFVFNAGGGCRTPGAGPDQPVPPPVLPSVTLNSAAPYALQFEQGRVSELNPLVVRATGTDKMDSIRSRDLYVEVEDPSGVFGGSGSVVFDQPLREAFRVRLLPNALPSGTHRGTLSLRVCLEQPCQNALPGMPLAVPYVVTIVGEPTYSQTSFRFEGRAPADLTSGGPPAQALTIQLPAGVTSAMYQLKSTTATDAQGRPVTGGGPYVYLSSPQQPWVTVEGMTYAAGLDRPQEVTLPVTPRKNGVAGRYVDVYTIIIWTGTATSPRARGYITDITIDYEVKSDP